MVSEEEIIWMSAVELSKSIRDGELSPVEVVDAFLNRIKKINPELNAFVTLTEESARKEAERAEEAVKKGEKLGPLHGVPVAIKDNIPVKGVRTTYGSKLYENYVPEEDYILVDRLKKAGAIILGKTNLPEFGLIPITDNPVFGPTRNPWDKTRTTGGSSGGSAAASLRCFWPEASPRPHSKVARSPRLGDDGGGGSNHKNGCRCGSHDGRDGWARRQGLPLAAPAGRELP